MANPNNRFARVTSVTELDNMFEVLTSPENLYADGERTQAEAKALNDRLVKDYKERESELLGF